MNIITVDVSGNYFEGKGTTGLCEGNEKEAVRLFDVAADDFPSQEYYWAWIWNEINQFQPDHIILEGYKLYNHKGKAASMQANSLLETPQLIGYLRMKAWENDTPCHIQFASDIKTRWSEKILQHKGILDEKNRFKGQQTNAHKRDALKHYMHFITYKLEGVK